MFPQCFSVSHTGKSVSRVTFCFQDANYAYATRQGILTKIRACEHLQKVCEHEQASTHLSFASNSSKGQILRALSNWMRFTRSCSCRIFVHDGSIGLREDPTSAHYVLNIFFLYPPTQMRFAIG